MEGTNFAFEEKAEFSPEIDSYFKHYTITYPKNYFKPATKKEYIYDDNGKFVGIKCIWETEESIYHPKSLKALTGHCISINNIDWRSENIPQELKEYIERKQYVYIDNQKLRPH